VFVLKVVIRGAGIIGLSIGWKLRQAGLDPRIIDLHPEHDKASWAAAGMLSSDFEALIDPDESEDLHRLSLRSASLWKDFAKDLQSETKRKIFISHGPTLGLFPTEFDLTRAGAVPGAGHVSIISRTEACRQFPQVVTENRTPVIFHNDGQVDNRSALKALSALCADMMTMNEDAADDADLVIECKGWRGADVRPVKGQMLSVRPFKGAPRVPVRWGAAYIVPKPDRVIIGATVEPDISDLATEADTIEQLFHAAIEVCPAIKTADRLEEWAGLRLRSIVA
jgi:glycine/D-amino acid oxidase-like deaminating enzyme